GPVRIDYAMPVAGEAALEIYTVGGRQVWRQPLGHAPVGERSCVWDGRLPGGDRAEPGVDFARLRTPRGVRHCRLLFLSRVRPVPLSTSAPEVRGIHPRTAPASSAPSSARAYRAV